MHANLDLPSTAKFSFGHSRLASVADPTEDNGTSYYLLLIPQNINLLRLFLLESDLLFAVLFFYPKDMLHATVIFSSE
jgi:hypothetical protein